MFNYSVCFDDCYLVYLYSLSFKCCNSLFPILGTIHFNLTDSGKAQHAPLCKLGLIILIAVLFLAMKI